MNIEICNSHEDQYGNSKENIFLAFGDSGSYLGTAIVINDTIHRIINE